MRSLKTFYQVTRPLACLTTFIGTWAAAVLFSQALFTPQNLAAATVMTLFCLASSLYYSAMAHKPQPEATSRRKMVPLVSGPAFPQWKRPLLALAGVIVLIAAIIMGRYLPLETIMVAGYTAWMVYRYTKLDGSEPYWLKRSLYGAGIAALCVLFSSAAVSTGLTTPSGVPDVSVVTATVFFLYLIREILKHMQVAPEFPALKRFPINVGEKTPAYLGTQGMLGMILLGCIVPLVVIMLPIESWRLAASPNLIISQFILSAVLVFMAWFIILFITGVAMMFEEKPKAVRPLQGTHYLVTACTWLMAVEAIAHIV